jgi:hypothetical protein
MIKSSGFRIQKTIAGSRDESNLYVSPWSPLLYEGYKITCNGGIITRVLSGMEMYVKLYSYQKKDSCLED